MMGSGDCRISLHDACILDVSTVGSTVHLKVEGALLDGAFRDDELSIEGVETITRDNEPVSRFSMEKTDCEIMELYAASGLVGLVVQWDDYARHSTDTVPYGFWGRSVALRVTQVGAITSHYGPLPFDMT